MKLSKKIVSLLLVLCMMLNVVPVFAASVTTSSGTIDTKEFPEGTIFIATCLLDFPGVLGTDYVIDAQASHYAVVGPRNAVGYASLDNFFRAPANQNYTVYALRASHSNGGNRGSAVTVGDAYLTFTSDATRNPSATGHFYFWCPSEEGTTVTLKKDNSFLVRQEFLSGHTSRLAAIALVPTDKLSGLTAVSGWTYSTDYVFTQEALEELTAATAEKYVLVLEKTEAAVKINNTDLTVENQAAVNAGAKVRDTDIFGDIIDQPTVADALAVAAESNIITCDITTLSNGLMPNMAVRVNGKVCQSLDTTEIKDGDVIVTESINATNFAPVQLAASDAGLTRNVDGFGVRTGTIPQLLIQPTPITSLVPDVYVDGALNKDSLKGAHLNGYLTLRSPGTTATFTGVTETWDSANSKVYFENIECASALNGAGSRLVLYPTGTSATKISATTNLLSNADLAVGKNNVKYHPAYTMYKGGEYWSYMFANLYITNSSTTNDVEVKISDAGDRYAITTDGAQNIALVTVTYGQNGEISSTTVSEQYIAFNSPYIGEINANQTVYVWGARKFEGTNMIPLTQPIVSSVN